MESRSEDEVTQLNRIKPEERGRPTVVNASKLKKAIGPVSIAKAPRSRGNASQHMDEAIERVVNPEISSQEAREVCRKRRELDGDGSIDVITSQEHNDVIIGPDQMINDAFAENVNEILEMLDRNSNDQDQEQEVDKEHEAAEFPNHESNGQELFSEPEPDHYDEPEMHWDDELEFAVEVSIDNEESYQPTHYFKKKLISEGSEVSTRPQRTRKAPVRLGYE